MTEPRGLHHRSSQVLASIVVVLGVVMVVSTIARGGGPFAYGVVMGLLFAGAGAGRLYLTRRG